MEIYSNQIKAKKWKVGQILEDVRHNSPTQGSQFEITDSISGVVMLRELEDTEYVVASLIHSKII